MSGHLGVDFLGTRTVAAHGSRDQSLVACTGRSQFPALLHGSDRVDDRHLDAAPGAELAGAAAHAQRGGARGQRDAPDVAAARVRRVGRRDRRPGRQSQAPDRHRGARHGPGARTGCARRDRVGDDGVGLRVLVPLRARVRVRPARGEHVAVRAGRSGRPAERHRAQQRDPVGRAARRPRDRRPGDRDRGAVDLLLRQRGVVPGGDRRARAPAPARDVRSDPPRRPARSSARGPAATSASDETFVSRWSPWRSSGRSPTTSWSSCRRW